MAENKQQQQLKEITERLEKSALIADLVASLPYIDDSGMARLMAETLQILKSMTEEAFSEIRFEPALNEGEAWEE